MLSRCVKVSMLNGPAKGEKGKFTYGAVKPVAARKVETIFPAAPAATETPLQAVPTAAAKAEPDALCRAWFGDLGQFS